MRVLEAAAPLTPEHPQAERKKIRLPNSATRRYWGQTFILLLRSVSLNAPYSLGFEGCHLRPGAWVEDSSSPMVVLERAGIAVPGRKGKPSQILWILWRYDKEADQWREIARAQSDTWEWALVLREPAYRALHPKPELEDVKRKMQGLVEGLVEEIDRRLYEEDTKLQVCVLTAVYERLMAKVSEIRT